MRTTFSFSHTQDFTQQDKASVRSQSVEHEVKAEGISFINDVKSVTRKQSFNFRNYSSVPMGSNTSL